MCLSGRVGWEKYEKYECGERLKLNMEEVKTSRTLGGVGEGDTKGEGNL